MQTRYLSALKDKRLVDRGNAILDRLFSNAVHSVRRLAADDSEAKAFYRFLQNDQVAEEDLIGNMAANCRACVSGKAVLCIQDTSEINLSAHRHRIRRDDHIGVTCADAQSLGFFIHPSLVVDAGTLMPYGFSDVRVWNRGQETSGDRSYAKKAAPISEKESYKWIDSSLRSKEGLREAQSVVIVQDREADIYEQFCLVPDERTDLLVRARISRTLAGGGKLFDHLAALPGAGHYQLALEGDKRKGTKKRVADMEVRFGKVTITANKFTDKGMPPCRELYAIEAREVTAGVANPICWRLLTTLPVEDAEMARLCIEWYGCRWMIEEVFRILKKEGFNIEASELTRGKAVRKLCLLMMETIVRLFVMQMAYAAPAEELSPRSCFSDQETVCMEAQMPGLEGRTEKLKNPYKPTDLKRYIWVVARLGGWKGYASERKPGITTFWIGLQKLADILKGWQTAQLVS